MRKIRSGKKAASIFSQQSYLAYVRDELHSYSHGTRELMELALHYIEDALKNDEKDRRIVWEASAIDAPIIYACGGVPISYIELARFGTRSDSAFVEEQLDIPGDVCSMAKMILGRFFQTGKDNVTLIHVNTAVCEPFNMLFEILRDNGFPVMYQDTALRTTDVSGEYRAKAIEERKKALDELSERICGEPLNEKRLSAELSRYNRILGKIEHINHLRRKHRTYLGNLASAYVMLGVGNYFGRPERYERALDELTSELESLAPGEYDDEVIPLVWSGARSVDFGICDALDQMGGLILDWNVPTNLHQYYSEEIPAIQSWLNYSLGLGADGKPAAGNVLLPQIIRGSNARGVLQYGYLGCPMCAVGIHLTQALVRKNPGIPCLDIMGSFPSEQISGQMRTRLEAFIEMLDSDAAKPKGFERN